jgi:phenylpyruvate tautomerase PptA (4-oxalocrotonate tautomerase family)
MPLYSAISQEGFLSDETKTKIAQEITRIHSTIMKVPRTGCINRFGLK